VPRYSEIVPHTITRRRSGAGPQGRDPVRRARRVYAPEAPRSAGGFFDTGVPTFGICYGFQAMAASLGGRVDRTGTAEFGGTPLAVVDPGVLFSGLPATQAVWMSHGDAVVEAPAGFRVTSSTPQTPVASFEDPERGLYGVQFHPEVLHSEHGQKVLEAFLDAAGCRRTWTMVNIVEDQVERIRAQIGGRRVVCGLSGGVDSAVAAALVQRAVGDQLTCVFVDHGLLRKGEAEQVEQDFVAAPACSCGWPTPASGSSTRWPG
jgi:GMP synthase (glutamine-hydrolysing)